MKLTVIAGPETGKSFLVSRSEIHLGRRKSCDVCVSEDPHVSRLHAIIRETRTGATVEDAGSHNGTLLNGRPVTAPVALAEGAEITIGSTVFRVELGTDEDSPLEHREDLYALVTEGLPPTVLEWERSAFVPRAGERTAPPSAGWTPAQLGAFPWLIAAAGPGEDATVVETAAEQLVAQLPAEWVCVFVPGQRAGRLTPAATRRQEPSDEGAVPIRLPLEAVRRALTKRCLVLTSEIAVAEGPEPEETVATEVDARSMLFVPLASQASVLGLLVAIAPVGPSDFRPADVTFLWTLADLLALSLTRERLGRELAHQMDLAEQMHRFVPEVPLQRLLRDEVATDAGAELVEATILEAEVRNLGALAQALPREELVSVLNEYLGRMYEIIRGHDGLVDKLVGTGLFAVFGSPEADGDQSVKAVRCGLAMTAAVQELNTRHEAEDRPALDFAVGISRGRVLHGTLGTADYLQYSVLGEPVDLCARLCDLARPGEVIISDAVSVNTWSMFHTVSRDSLPRRDSSEPLKTFRVMADRAGSKRR